MRDAISQLESTCFFFSPVTLPDLFLFSFRLVTQQLLLEESEKVLSFQEEIQLEQLPLLQWIEFF